LILALFTAPGNIFESVLLKALSLGHCAAESYNSLLLDALRDCDNQQKSTILEKVVNHQNSVKCEGGKKVIYIFI
jgi:hypothetical protein